jgi:uncharacterized coiled-coil protein SlyX
LPERDPADESTSEQSTIRAPRRAVYRALVGGYETLREEEVARDSSVPFICFTDDPTLTSDTWEIVHVERRLANDTTRSARALKILGHPALDAFDETLWIDNTVALRAAPDELFDLWLGDADVAAPLHSFRASVLAEAEVVIDTGLDDFARVYEQLAHYLAVDRGALEANPHWTGMLARRRTPATTRAMQSWWEDVLRYSRRDQLSFVPVMRAHAVRLHSVPLDSYESDWHAWPWAEGRDATRLGTGLREALRPAAAEVGVLQQRLDDTVHTMSATLAHRDEMVAALEHALTESRALVASTRAELDTIRHELDTVRHERNVARLDLAAAEARAASLSATLERKSERLDKMRRRVNRLEDQLEDQLEARAIPPRPVVAAVGPMLS